MSAKTVKRGIWGGPAAARANRLPAEVRAKLDEMRDSTPDDWCMLADRQGVRWFVARLYDDDLGGDLIAAKVEHVEPWGDNLP